MGRKKSSRRRWWRNAGLVAAGLVLLLIAVFRPPVSSDGDTPLSPGPEEGTYTVKIDDLLDGPKVCFAKIDVGGVPKFVNLGPYPACQEHEVGQEIVVDEDDIEGEEGANT